jgi:putative two-component system response regulator
MAIIDVFDALTTARPYKEAMAFSQAFEELRKEAGHGLHRRDLVEAFIALSAGGRLEAFVREPAAPPA